MAKTQITVDVSKEAYEVGVAISGILKAVKEGKSVAEIAALELPALFTAAEGAQKIPAEYAEDHAAFLKAFLIPVADAAGGFISKPAGQVV